MTKSRILVVDDERDICEVLEFNLQNEGYHVDCAYSAEQALEVIANEYDLILLDVMMGEMSGYEFAEKIRSENNLTPIIFLTARDKENDMITAFNVGADDYISKPFSIKEVIVRVKAVIRRSSQITESGETPSRHIFIGDIKLDTQSQEAFVLSERLALTKREFEILYLLASNPQQRFSREDILHKLWNDSYVTERTVDVHIARIRKKLGDRASCINNRVGYGYKINF